MHLPANFLRNPAISIRGWYPVGMVEMLEALRSGRLSGQSEHRMERSAPTDHLIMWAVAGAGFAASGKMKTRAHPGTVMVLPAGRRHSYAADPRQPWDLMWVHFRGPAAGPWVDRFGRRFGLAAELGVHPELIDTFTELIATHQRGGPSLRLAHHLCWGLLGRIEYRLELGSTSPVDQHAEALDRVQRHIEAHLDEPLTVEQLAEVARLSPRHFTRLSRVTWRLPPMAYVIRQRLARACLLLTETSLPIGSIAAQSGFNDPYHFSRLFHRHIGQTPTRFRRSRSSPTE